jgi:predicted amino acid-binding ACT domain protein
MDQNMLERLLAQMEACMTARMEAKIDSSQEKMDAIEHKMLAKMETTQHKIKVHHEEMMAKMDAWRGVTPARLEEEEPAPEETEVVAKSQEVP